MSSRKHGSQGTRADVGWGAGRRLVVVDVENIVGGPCSTAARASWARRRLYDVIGHRPGDHVVVGVDASGLEHVAWEWSEARKVIGRGADGADHALLAVLDEDVVRRFDEVVIASGDGIFSDVAARLVRYGVDVTVASHATTLSARMRLAAPRVLLLSGSSSRVPAPRSVVEQFSRKVIR